MGDAGSRSTLRLAVGTLAVLGWVMGMAMGSMWLLGLAWPPYALARIQLAATGRLPWRFMGFLHDMHQLGVLRQAGGVYQFRHADLQDRLAAERTRAGR